jgi:hypothetical protein
MAKEYGFRTKAHALCAQARALISPSARRSLMKQADNRFRQAEEIRKSDIVQAAFPKPGLKVGE